jgi:hypothetical protein
MAILYSVVEDDPLDSGGSSRVFASRRSCTIKGEDGKRRRMVSIGDDAWCDACKSAGAIVAGVTLPDKKRLLDVPSGRRQAVGGDIVLCKCAQHPRIIALNGRSWKIVDDTGGIYGGAVAAAASYASTHGFSAEDADDDLERYFEIVDAKTGAPIEGMTYKQWSDGQSLGNDATLAGGRTSAFSVKDHPNVFFVAWIKGYVR